jgi:predicted RNA-binding protein with RPS1 domain
MTKTSTARLNEEGIPGFDWDLYEDGWNGVSLQRNKRVKLNKTQQANHVVVYSHDRNAAKQLKAYFGSGEADDVIVKEHSRGDILPISDIRPLNENTAVVTVKGGASELIVDLNKENKFFNIIQTDNGQSVTKDQFVNYLKYPVFKEGVINMGLNVKVGTDKEKASIWDGYVVSLQREMIEQTTKPSKAYVAHVLSANQGGFVVEIQGAVKAFLPYSLISTLKSDVATYQEKYLDNDIEVMVESYNPVYKTFVVSRVKYLEYNKPAILNQLIEKLNQNPNMTVEATITNATDFGVFVVVDEYITGMLHKTLVSDDLRQMMRDGTVPVGEKIDVYFHRIENEDNRIIFSDVALEERDAIIARREAEDEAEKAAIAAANGNTTKE